MDLLTSVSTVIGIVGTVVAMTSTLHALATQRGKRRLEHLVQSKLSGLAGAIEAIRGNPVLAHQNIDWVLSRVDQLRDHKDLSGLVNHLAWAQGDSATTHRLLDQLLLDVLALQEGLFGTRTIARADQANDPKPSTPLPHPARTNSGKGS